MSTLGAIQVAAPYSPGEGLILVTPPLGSILPSLDVVPNQCTVYPRAGGASTTFAVSTAGGSRVVLGSVLAGSDQSFAPGDLLALQYDTPAGGGTISLTTTGTSGAATFSGGTLNIPQYSGGGGSTAQVVTIAASNSPSRYSAASYTCNGTTDTTTINTALAALSSVVTNESITGPTFAVASTCEATTGFAGVNSATIALDNSVFKFGSGSISVTPSGSASNPGLILSGLSITAATYKTLDFWANTTNVAAEFSIILTMADASTFQYNGKVASIAGAWSQVRVQLGDYLTHSGTMGTIASVQIALIGGGSNAKFPPVTDIFWIDQIAFTTDVFLANVFIHPQTPVITNGGATTYVEGTDYAIAYDTGELIVYSAGAITSGESLTATTYRHGGGTAKFCSGTFNLAGQLLYYPYTHIDNTDGAAFVPILPGSWAQGNKMFAQVTTTQQTRKVSMTGGTLVGYRETMGEQLTVHPFGATYFDDIKLTNVNIRDFTGGVWTFQNGSNINADFQMIGCTLDNVGPAFDDSNHASHYGPINATLFAGGSAPAVWIKATDQVRLVGNKILNSPGDGVYFQDCNGGVFASNMVKNIGMGGWFCGGTTAGRNYDNTVTGNTFTNCGSRSVSTSPCQNLTITGNTIDGSGRENIWLYGVVGGVVTGNKLSGAGLKDSLDGQGFSTAFSISVTSSATQNTSGVLIGDNTIDASSTYCAAAVNIAAGGGSAPVGTILSCNQYIGTSNTISDSGTGSQIFEPFTPTIGGLVGTGPVMNGVQPLMIQASTGTLGLGLRVASSTAATDSPVLQMAKARGTLGSPTVVSVNDRLGTILVYGCDTTPGLVTAAEISFVAVAVGSAGVEGEIRIASASSASATRNTRYRCNNTGAFINVATTVPSSALVNNDEVLFCYSTNGTLTALWKNNSGTVGTVSMSPLIPLAAPVTATTHTAAANELTTVDTTSNAVTITLEAGPPEGTENMVKMVVLGGSNAVTISRGGASDVFNVAGGPTTLTLSALNQFVRLQYQNATGIWIVTGAGTF